MTTAPVEDWVEDASTPTLKSTFFKREVYGEEPYSKIVKAMSLPTLEREYYLKKLKGDVNYIDLRDFGGIGDGKYDNRYALDLALSSSRISKKALYVPAGRWYASGNHDISGITMSGSQSGYYNKDGTVFVGDGTNTMFEQKQVGLSNITHHLSGFRVENVSRGLVYSYSIYGTLTDVTVIAIDEAITLGINTIIGPIWNVFSRVKAESTTSIALSMGGKDWCNSNQFDTCDFKGYTAAVKINSLGGYGALDNVFRNTEIRGEAVGVDLSGINRATSFEHCYIEPKGPSIVSRASTLDLQLQGNVYGSTGNDVPGYSPSFIDHKAGTLSVRVIGGWVTTNSTPRQSNLTFIGSDSPSTLQLEYVSEPKVSADSVGFRLHDTSKISTAPRTQHGDFTVSKHGIPRISLQYPDGSRPFSIRRNGSQGGADYGVYFRNENFDSFTIDSLGHLNLLQHLGTAKSVPATTLGSVVSRMPIFNSAGVLLGQIPIYGTIT